MSLHIPLFCWYMLQIMLLSSIPKVCQRRACPNFCCFTPREKGCFRDMIFIDFPSRFGETDKLLSVNVEVYIFSYFHIFSFHIFHGKTTSNNPMVFSIVRRRLAKTPYGSFVARALLRDERVNYEGAMRLFKSLDQKKWWLSVELLGFQVSKL